jgi:poly-gamma-glutamate capsule biosynthesis protein CapA/YwtB (metallophosphatase superfamily)
VSGAVTFCTAGSGIFTRRLSLHTSPGFTRLIETLRSSQVTFMNLEGPMIEQSAYPTRQGSLGPYFRCEQWLAEELRWAGIDMVSLANNHMSDYSPEAIYTNQRLLSEAGIVFAGAGATLSEARQPAYLELEHARIALLAVDSSHEVREPPKVLMASNARDGRRARPGVNGLRWTEEYRVSPVSMSYLHKIVAELGIQPHPREEANRDASLTFAHQRFAASDAPGVRTACDPNDLADILRWVREARRQADYVLVSHHVHAAAAADRTLPADFASEFAHAAIDAGADAYLGHGDWPKGIEIHRGKPIFWELGNIGWEAESISAAPDETYEFWGLGSLATPADLREAREPVYGNDDDLRQPQLLASFTMQDGELTQLQFAGIQMIYDSPRYRRGWPELCDAATTRRFVNQVACLSRPFGTVMCYQDGRGIVELT